MNQNFLTDEEYDLLRKNEELAVTDMEIVKIYQGVWGIRVHGTLRARHYYSIEDAYNGALHILFDNL